MARINLLPWRQEERERKNKEFGILLGATAILTALAIILTLSLLNRELSKQQAANDMIAAENTRLDGVLTEIATLEEQREEMISRMEIIHNLQGLRSVPVRIWDDIARAMPSSMYLTGVKREGDILTINGYAANTTVVSDLIRNLDASEWLDDSIMPSAKDDNVQAYAATAQRQQKAQNSNTAPRPVYPEDSYIFFTVSSKIVTKMPTAVDETQVDNNQTVVATQQQIVATASTTNASAPAAEQTAPASDQQVQTDAPVPATENQAAVNAPANQATAQQPAGQAAPADSQADADNAATSNMGTTTPAGGQ